VEFKISILGSFGNDTIELILFEHWHKMKFNMSSLLTKGIYFEAKQTIMECLSVSQNDENRALRDDGSNGYA